MFHAAQLGQRITKGNTYQPQAERRRKCLFKAMNKVDAGRDPRGGGGVGGGGQTVRRKEREGCVAMGWGVCVGGGGWRDVAGPRVRCGMNDKTRLFQAEAVN